MTAGGKKKVAILGGGVGALAAAFELTDFDRNGDLFDVTVHTIGWRLGGKGAVGRNAKYGFRAEEHGLHVWAGFYDNAFDLVQRCYDAQERELDRDPPFGTWSNAFLGLDQCILMEKENGAWRPWQVKLQRNGKTPGISGPSASPLDYLKVIVTRASEYYATSRLRRHIGSPLPAQIPDWFSSPDIQEGPLFLAKTLIEMLPSDPQQISGPHLDQLASLIQSFLDQLRKVPFEALALDDDSRHGVIILELGLTMALGMIVDGVIQEGFDHIDSQEYSSWISQHGCSNFTRDSALVRGCYDYVFGYIRGVRNVGAGTAVRALLRFALSYKGSFFYVMRATMGELLFAPLYRVLAKRNVKFEFFHRVKNLLLSEDGLIDRIEIDVQAHVKEPPYHPLVSIDSDESGPLDSWPSQPLYDQLIEGEEIRQGDGLNPFDLESAWTSWKGSGKTLIRDQHFDIVILGIGLGAFGDICGDLVSKRPSWRALVERVRTTQTLGLQLWTMAPTSGLGWRDPQTVLTSFADPLNSCGDMSVLLPLENWPDKAAPRGIAYFVGTFDDAACIPRPGSDSEFPAEEHGRARLMGLSWVADSLPVLWPAIRGEGGGTRWDLLFDPNNGKGHVRFDAQYLRVNINPSDRYVLSVAGSVQYRMTADGSGIPNLHLAGDWVRTGLNAGCIEAAVMAGRAAAGAVTGAKMTIPGSNDFDSFDLPAAVLPALNVLRSLGRGLSGGTGCMDAHCVVLLRPVSFVEKRLPEGLRLVPLGKIDEATRVSIHPVVWIFSHQRSVRPGFVPFGGMNYFEFIELVPFVEHTELGHMFPGPFSYMPTLLLDQLPPVIIGVNLYGFNKKLAQIRTHYNCSDIRSEVGQIAAQFIDVGPPGRISEFKGIAALRRLMELPQVSKVPGGEYIYSMMDLHLDAATCQSASGFVKIGPPFIPDGPQSVLELNPAPRDLGDLVRQPFSFRLTTQWHLSLPFLSPTVGGMQVPRDARSFASAYSQAVFGRVSLRR
jgi:uncharacterized protein with NAD-binding domain and iron-sulfur cluster